MGKSVAVPEPMMQPVVYEGRTYFTGHYFHQMYRGNSEGRGKHKRVGDFMRLVRSIESYPQYVEDKDIVELEWGDVKGETRNANLASLVRSNSYNPVMLISATAQVALTHHLDDEVSKAASVAVNRSAAKAHATPALRDIRAAKELLSFFIEAGRMLGTDEAMARAVAADKVKHHTGIDVAPLLAGNSVAEAPVTPTELGKAVGMSGKAMNAALADQGYQVKGEDDQWHATDKAKGFCTVNPYKAPHSDHTGYRILWYRSVLKALNLAAA
ncbi:MAG: hypothetical protein EOM24_30295 [Chloroflexia bacterium]|nr:hypothetical protein [Chloroflexia bacterium]